LLPLSQWDENLPVPPPLDAHRSIGWKHAGAEKRADWLPMVKIPDRAMDHLVRSNPPQPGIGRIIVYDATMGGDEENTRW
jgi:hypothetical protein